MPKKRVPIVGAELPAGLQIHAIRTGARLDAAVLRVPYVIVADGSLNHLPLPASSVSKLCGQGGRA